MGRDNVVYQTYFRRDDPTDDFVYVPTLGFPTQALDFYRMIRFVSTDYNGINSCMTDVDSCIGLARVIEGPIESAHDLLAAEAALQVIMFHDRVDVMVPGFKLDTNGFRGYRRIEPHRSQLAFDLLQELDPFDQIYATEFAHADNGRIQSSTTENSTLLSKDIAHLDFDYLAESPLHTAALSLIPLKLGIPAYFSNKSLSFCSENRGFSGALYSRISNSWHEALGQVPLINFAVNLPPLLTIVLDRSRTRDSIPETIRDLRKELVGVRDECSTLNDLVTGALDQAEVERRTVRITQSFDAAFPASRRTPNGLILPLLQLYKAIKNPLDTAISCFNPNYIPSDPKLLANRTISGKVFSQLLQTDSMHSLSSHFFTQSELLSISTSMD